MQIVKHVPLIGVFVLVVGWIILNNSPSVGQTARNASWEYKVDICDFQVHKFNASGQQGWELITITENSPNTGYLAVFKRPSVR